MDTSSSDQRMAVCEDCRGSGRRGRGKCATCGGEGKLRSVLIGRLIFADRTEMRRHWRTIADSAVRALVGRGYRFRPGVKTKAAEAAYRANLSHELHGSGVAEMYASTAMCQTLRNMALIQG